MRTILNGVSSETFGVQMYNTVCENIENSGLNLPDVQFSKELASYQFTSLRFELSKLRKSGACIWMFSDTEDRMIYVNVLFSNSPEPSGSNVQMTLFSLVGLL